MSLKTLKWVLRVGTMGLLFLQFGLLWWEISIDAGACGVSFVAAMLVLLVGNTFIAWRNSRSW